MAIKTGYGAQKASQSVGSCIFGEVLFNSLEFLGFFLLVTVGYFLLPHRQRWWWLLGASAWFYLAFVPVFILVLGFIILVDYCAGLVIERSTDKTKRWGLYASLGVNLGTLALFKYVNWLNGEVLHLFGVAPLPYLDVVLPLGLSFHTFQALSYILEVYHGRQKAERHLGIYALYVLFFPQLVAGPIERPQAMLHQFRERHVWNVQRALSGIYLMLWGLFKKVVVADGVVFLVEQAFKPYAPVYGATILVGTLAFAIQIYCDFSGYSDIAVGAGEVLGFKLTRNFRNPYFATSLSAFWRRWHISLSEWFRDYVYIPLGGSRVHSLMLLRNLLVTFALSGLWHGAGWTYLLWGLYHGVWLWMEHITKKLRQLIPATLRRFLGGMATFTIVFFGWIFFRAPSWETAKHLFGGWWLYLGPTWQTMWDTRFGLSAEQYILLCVSLPIWLVVELVQAKGGLRQRLSKYPYLELILGSGLLGAILLLGHFQAKTPFIYFQF